MKKILLLLSFVVLTTIAVRSQPYVFTQSTSTYSNLTGTTLISSPGWDDFTVYPFKLPFPFKFFGTTHDSIFMMGGFAGFIYDGSGGFANDEIYFYDTELIDRSTFSAPAGTISYVITGVSPSRILKFQTSNAGFSQDTSANYTNYTNVQLWLYETSNVVEIHNGPHYVDANSFFIPGTGPTVGIFKDQFSFVSLSGPASNPTASSSAASLYVTGAPPDGKVYRFAPNTADINDLTANNPFEIYPNPSRGNFFISSFSAKSNVEMVVYSSVGQEMLRTTLDFANGKKEIETSLPAGIYFVIMHQEGRTTSQKLVIE
jgi:hypothetical protein